jgi:hypothetical protein
MVMAYLVKTQRVTRKYAQRFLQTKRPETNPNPIFIAQVRKYHRTLFPEDYANTRKTTTDTMGRSPLASKPINALGGSQSMESICDGPQSLAIAMNELSISSASYAPQQANEGIETASPREKPLNENIESPIRRLLISDEQVQSGNEQSSRAVPLLLSIPKSRNSLKIQTANLSSKQP